MTLLVIETATAACSVALFDAGVLRAERHEVVGRGHAERLVPMIAEVMAGARAATILVDVGPGSFTGVRVGLAAARALALGWGAEVRGFSALALIAARAGGDVVAAIPGGHGEVFVQRFAGDPLQAAAPLASLPPAAARAFAGDARVAGPGAALLDRAAAADPWPRAADAVLLPAALVALTPVPLYGRAPDAKMPG